ncbi:MAG: SpoIVB peptidase [Clostridia bacterium]|nr:SpoIVB peptidase [Clostridia bacterium]
MKKIIKTISVVLLITCSYIFSNIYYLSNNTPNTIYSDNFLSLSGDNALNCSVAGNSDNGNYELKYLNIFPVKNITIKNKAVKNVVLCGNQFGIKLYSSGSIITSVSGVLTESGSRNPAYEAGLRKGDIIISINDEEILSNADIERIVKNSDEKLKIVYERNNKKYKTIAYSVVCATDNCKKLGIWIKDSLAGIGTATFYIKETGVTAGLGHGIYDNETNVLIPLNEGAICEVDNFVVSRSVDGVVGDISGNLSHENIGEIIKNSDNGVYFNGIEYSGELVEIGSSSKIKKANAQIYLSLNGEECRYYDCEIKKINYNEKTKNLIIKIIDEELLEKTGGIIQGMSGAPILQNGKLIGAVTHVLVNDTSSGYGIFAENMLETALD